MGSCGGDGMIPFLVLFVMAGTAPAQTTAARAPRPLAGAIRWDAWHGGRGEPGLVVQRSLGPEKWHYRLPFFARILSTSEVSIDGASQEVMDREIAYAARAGLDYWAFVTYEPSSPMSLGLQHYLASARKLDLRFCLITAPGNFGAKGNSHDRISRLARLMSDDAYLRVLHGRPVVFVGFIDDDAIHRGWGEIGEFRKAVEELRRLARESGAGDPYVVIMDFSPVRAGQLRKDLAADAISSYCTSAHESAAPFASLAAYAERFWDAMKGTGSPVLPIVMSGWDRRPRVEHPVPWERSQLPGVGIEKWYAAPQPDELASHLGHALDWIRSNPASAPANAALIYAWNENDEGGWLVPTLAEGAARLNAIGRVLNKEGGL